MQALVVSGRSVVPSKPPLADPLPMLVDAFATVPTERLGVLSFIVIGKPRERIVLTIAIKHAAADALAHPFYCAMALAEIAAGLRQLEEITKARSRVSDGDGVAQLYRQELRIVPAWLLRQAASAHIRVSKWFPTIAELIEHARTCDCATVSACERLWRIAEAPLH